MSVVILVLFVIYTIAPFFKSGPTFAAIPSNDHKFKLKTSILQTDFFVTQQYFE